MAMKPDRTDWLMLGLAFLLGALWMAYIVVGLTGRVAGN